MNTDMRQQIQAALLAFSSSDLRTASIGLLNTLGYRSEKTLDLDNTPDAFLAEFDKRDRNFRKNKALFERWKSVEFLFQITDDEVQSAGGQGTLFDSGYDHGNYQSYLFFALDLEKNHYTRTQLADITREINLLFDMPVMVLMRHNSALTFSVIDRRLHKKDQSRDVLEKVKLIKDIRYQDPHRAHIEILYDLSLPTLMAKHECRDFKQLHEAWRTTLDTNELNKKFYRELADWYFWALDHVEFPADVEKDEATRNATSVIRLLTRLIFCWFLKEKGLIPTELFNERKLAGVLKPLKDDDSTFYRAILQNLFFGTLNQRMNIGGKVNRRFANDGSFLERKDEYGVKNLYRYQKLFAIAEEEAVKLFSDIPFLNGGLFDCLDKEDDSGKVIYVDGFTRNPRKQPKVPNFLFFSDYRTLDLSDAYGDKRKKKEKVRGLINLLDSYKFTVTENTPIEEEIALDPELLGKVFENLLASYNPETGTTARKQTGSFYTPREIVNYMVDESLIAYLEGQLKAKVPKLAEMKDLQDLLREVFAYTEKVHPFDEEEVEALIDAIDTCKILDPACGSGAFPMGILHKLVFILRKLDPHNERWKQRQIVKAEQIPDVSAREIAVGAIEKDFETNDLDYGRKLYLIENCIYGVDIQPIAIQISKLRFFVSLICDQRTNKNKAQNCGVRPLPNLETKFVAANTLISLDRGQDQLLLTDPRLAILEEELAAVRHRHFAAQRRRDKLALQRRDAEIRKEIAVVLAGSMSVEASHQLAAWNPYDQNASAPFFDLEWMYGIPEGFDIVIGNPPYLRIQGITNSTPHLALEYKKAFRSATGRFDLYCLFLEAGLAFLNPKGIVNYIMPLKWTNSDFGKGLRSIASDGKHVLRVISLEALQVFSASTYSSIVWFSKSPVDGFSFVEVPGDTTDVDSLERWLSSLSNITSAQIASSQISEAPWVLTGGAGANGISDILSKIAQQPWTLKDVFEYVSQGVVTVGDKIYLLRGSIDGNRFVGYSAQTKCTVELESKMMKPLLKGDDVKRYSPLSNSYFVLYPHYKKGSKTYPLEEDEFADNYPLAYAYLSPFRKELTRKKIKYKTNPKYWYALHRSRDMALFETEKIVVQETSYGCNMTLDMHNHYTNTQVYNLVKKDVVSEDNRFWLSILNSSLLWFYLQNTGTILRGGYFRFKTKYLEPFSLPKTEKPKDQQPLVDLVDRILSIRKRNPEADVSDIEVEINHLVYGLYGLTPNEVAIVEEWNI